ncbi:hypothetical protein HDU96_002578 [Phlyctochytrium bullatum]|nr:hypothetical protein HDU96_002578 [Phlyctochytrium bullatum]
MGRSGRIMFCNCLFWTKVFIALVLATTGLAYFAYKVYDLRQYALNNPASINPGNSANSNSGGNQPNAFTSTQNTPIPIPTQTDGTVAQDCSAGRNGRARLQPPTGRIMLGYHLNWAYDTPTNITRRIGRSPGVINAFMQLDPTRAQPFDYNMLMWHASEVQLVKGILELTIEPIVDIAQIKDETYDQIAGWARDINVQKGVPILLRFGHEMNGNWVLAYGYRPIAYKTAFRKMATAVRKVTNMTAMVWAPNVGIMYPFGDGDPATTVPIPTAANGGAEFQELDTNRDGRISRGDDPYEPFYPGDEYVDWVGLSIYYYPREDYANPGSDSDKQFWNIAAPTLDYFTTQMNVPPENLQNFYDDAAYLPGGANFNDYYPRLQFYKKFAEGKRKPMMLPETGAPYIVADQNNVPAPTTAGLNGAPRLSEREIKSGWWQQLYNQTTVNTWPYLKLMVQFEEQKLQANKIQNWAVTNATAADVLPAYRSFLDTAKNVIALGTDMSFKCDGSVEYTF